MKSLFLIHIVLDRQMSEHRIEITLEEREPDHDGFCSDVSDENDDEYTKSEIVIIHAASGGLIARLKEIGALDPETGEIDVFLVRVKEVDELVSYDVENIPCNMGSGYCGMVGYRLITAMRLL